VRIAFSLVPQSPDLEKSASGVDVVLEAGLDALVHELHALLRQAAGLDPDAAGSPLYVEQTPLSQRQTLADSGIRDGCVVGIGGVAPAAAIPPPGTTQVRVVNGLETGTIFQVSKGSVLVGRFPAAAVGAGRRSRHTKRPRPGPTASRQSRSWPWCGSRCRGQIGPWQRQ
jgi:hypothetical protein